MAQFCLGLNSLVSNENPDEVFLFVTTNEFIDVTSMQFSISFDPEAYEAIELVENNLVDLTDRNFNTRYKGTIGFAWFHSLATGVTFTQNEPLFVYKFKKLKESDIPFALSNEPTSIEVSMCPPGKDCKVLNNFQDCNTGQNLSPSIKGQLFVDENKNCELEASERINTLKTWRSWNIAASQDGKYYFSGFLKEDGSYDLKLFPGENLIEIVRPGPFYTICEASFIINTADLVDENFIKESLIQVTQECPLLQVNLGSFQGDPCEDTYYLLGYSNNGTVAATDVYVDLNLDYRIEVAALPSDVIDLGNNNYRFNIGQLSIGESKIRFIRVNLPCELTAEEMLRNNARIFPVNNCGTNSQSWTGASLKVNGQCEGNQVVFEFENVGNGDMQEPINYVVIEDAVIFRTKTLQLPRGAKTKVSLPANGATYFIQSEQERGHPGNYNPSAFVEACGRTTSDRFSTGFANRFPETNNDNLVAVNYQGLVKSNKAERLLAAPVGFGTNHLLEPNNTIEYTLEFNASNNSSVVIVDELSPFLDITTFKPIAANNPYDYSLDTGVLTITVPPTLSNSLFDLDSYIKFSIQPKTDLPMGTRIENKATVQYSTTSIEETNIIFHTIEKDFVEKLTPTKEIELVDNTVAIFPNPSSGKVIFSIKDWRPMTYHLSIFDVNGRLLQENRFNNSQYLFERGELLNGTYLYRLVYENGKVANGFFALVD